MKPLFPEMDRIEHTSLIQFSVGDNLPDELYKSQLRDMCKSSLRARVDYALLDRAAPTYHIVTLRATF
jgi:hypothetical protein